MFGGVAQVLNLVIPSVPIVVWVPLLLGLTLALLIGGGYERIERLAMVKVGFFTLLTFLAAMILTRAPEFNWSELVTSDHRAAFKFYSALFGWQRLSGFEMAGMGEYLIFGQGSDDLGGMFTKTAQMPMPPSWAYYIHVDDLDATISRATSKRAKLMNGPMELPENAGPRWARTRVAQLTDPQGAFFALHGPAQKP